MGGLTTNWTSVATVAAQIDPITGREQLQGDQVTSILTHEIVMRYRPGIVPKMRLIRQGAGNQAYEIHAVTNVEMRNRQLLLQCSEIQMVGA